MERRSRGGWDHGKVLGGTSSPYHPPYYSRSELLVANVLNQIGRRARSLLVPVGGLGGAPHANEPSVPGDSSEGCSCAEAQPARVRRLVRLRNDFRQAWFWPHACDDPHAWMVEATTERHRPLGTVALGEEGRRRGGGTVEV